jgi:hypothetical protein
LFERARELNADVLVTLDSDGQHDPDQIPLLVEPIKQYVAVVVLGSRFLDKKGIAEMPLYRQFGIKVITKLTNASGKNGVSDSQSGFRAYGKKALEQMSSISENGMSASIELIHAIHKRGLKVCEVPISCKYSKNSDQKTSKKNPLSQGAGLLMSIVKMIVEERPLPMLGLPGVACAAIGILFGVWMINLYAESGQITTNIALASIGFILIGCFLISTAITLYAITRLSTKLKQ